MVDRISRFELSDSGESFDAGFNETFTPVCAEGVDLQLHMLGQLVRAGQPQPGITAGVASTGLNPGSFDIHDLARYLDRSLRSLTRDLTVVGSDMDMRVFGLLSNGVALAESAVALIKDRRAVEALQIAARLFELSVLTCYFVDSPEAFERWLTDWINTSMRDQALAEADEKRSGRTSNEPSRFRGPISAAGTDDSGSWSPVWPPASAWLRQAAADQDRLRTWWLWRRISPSRGPA